VSRVAVEPLKVLRQVKWEQREYWRNPETAGFTFAMPVLFLVIFMAINGNQTTQLPGAGHIRFAQYYVPTIVAFGLISACYTNLAFALSIRRHNGILKRVQGTPLAPATYLSGLVANAVIASVIITALITMMGLLFYGIVFPNRFLGLGIAVAAASFCFSALGAAVSTVIPNEDAAPAIINFLLFPLLFISGAFIPVPDSSVLAKVAEVFPVRHLISLLVSGVFRPTGSGTGILAGDVAVIVAWGVLGVFIATRRFRWEPGRA